MAKYTIKSPVEGYRGDLAGLIFRDGVATADDTTDGAALAYCRRRGYTVEPVDVEEVEATDPDEVESGEGHDEADEVDAEAQVGGRPKEYAAKPEWVTWAVDQGADPDDAEKLTKQQLIEQY